MRRLALIATALAALAVPAAAPAKEISTATVCGANGCHTLHDRDGAEALADAERVAAHPDHAARYYTVRFGMTEGDETFDAWTVKWAPGLDIVRSETEQGPVWWTPQPAAERLLVKLTAGLRSFPARGLHPLHGQSDNGQLPPEEFDPAAEAAAKAPAAATSANDGGGVAWPLAAGIGLLLAGGVALALRAWTRRRRGTDGPLPA